MNLSAPRSEIEQYGHHQAIGPGRGHQSQDVSPRLGACIKHGTLSSSRISQSEWEVSVLSCLAADVPHVG